MKYFTQTDPLWANDDMAMLDDKMWRWACLVTATCNILNDITGVEFTPKQFNRLLKENKGYLGLYYPNTSINSYSNLRWSAVTDLFGINVEFDVKKNKYEEKKGYFYIAMVIHPLTGFGHYINMLRKEDDLWVCFDVEDGKTKKYIDDQIKGLTRLSSKNP
jgi:hypothetical protein